MNKSIKEFLTKVNIFCLILSLIFRVFIFILNKFFQLSILGSITTEIVNFIILFSAFFLFINREILIYIIVSLTIVNTVALIIHVEPKEYYFKSPNRINTLVAIEHSHLLNGWVDFYEKKYFIFKKKIENSTMNIDNGYRAFHNNNFIMTWINDKKVQIYISECIPRVKIIKLN